MEEMSKTADQSQIPPIAGTVRDGDRLLITTSDAQVAPTQSDPCDQIRLHFTYLDQFADIGIIASGWLCDPGDWVAQLTVSGEEIDLLNDAVVIRGPEIYETFDVAPAARPELGFVAVIAERGLHWQHGVSLAVHLKTGITLERFASAVGRLSDIYRIIDTAPVEYALRIAERAFLNWRRRESEVQPLPRYLNDLCVRVHRRIDAAQAPCVEVREVFRVGTAGMLVTGRFDNSVADPVQEIVVASLSGRRVSLPVSLPRTAGRVSAADKGDGFAVFVPVENLAGAERHWRVEIRLASGSIERTPFVFPAARDPIEDIPVVLSLVDPSAPGVMRLLTEAVSPAVDALWSEARGAGAEVSPTEKTYGEPRGAVQVSIIVPVYRRIDLTHHQIACFSNDAQLSSDDAPVELLYVLDDPRLTDAFERSCRDLYDIYRLPFRCLFMHRNAGYAGANNAGAAAAAGSILVFLNSDVLPKRAGWVGELVKSYRSLPRCGVLGCRLLYEDGSIQHAGMSFRRSCVLPEAWENDHPWKGLPVAFDPCRAPTRVAAVTGACMMIEQALFRLVGGWSEQYVLGDFEDSDLCLRAYQQGWNVYYTPQVEHYHLERQSMAAEAWRQNLTLHNMWRHSRNWDSFIPTIVDLAATGG
jgi:GT2 family glycosyltransferase